MPDSGSLRGIITRLRCWLLGAVATAATVQADPIPMKSVEATFHAGDESSLARVIDDIEAGPQGWSVGPELTKPQALVIRSAKPVMAAELDITLFFLSGRGNHSIAEFDLAYTTDAEPSVNGNWEPLVIQRYSSDAVNLARLENGHLRALGGSTYGQQGFPDDTYRLVAQLPGARATGFRLRAFPLLDQKGVPSAMSWSDTRDFLLTEFRVEEHVRATTNIALHCPATSSHRLFGQLRPGSLTDGQPSTIAHPLETNLGAQFDFDIDLGRSARLDHINLLGRGDEYLDRFSQVRIQLYEQDPEQGAEPVWTGIDRPDGSHPGPGEHDAIRAGLGQGTFRGRYLRLSTDSQVPYSPQFAEVEAYEARTLELVSAIADGKELPVAGELNIPPRVKRLSLRFRIPQIGLPRGDLFRWRMPGELDEWQVSRTMILDIPCPPAGRTVFEAQALHSDREWDATLFTFPIIVRQYFWETRGFQVIVISAAILGAAALSRFVTKRRAARQLARAKARAALAEERSRIARDLHDHLGASLTELSLLGELAGRSTPPAGEACRIQETMRMKTLQMVRDLDEIVWAVSPRNDTMSSFAAYLHHHAAEFFATSPIRCRLDIMPDLPDLRLNVQERHNLFLAAREAMNNVAKHSRASEVWIRLHCSGGMITLVVEDDGCGFDPASADSGRNGLTNMRARMESIGGHCELVSQAGRGCRVSFTLTLGPSALE